MSIVIAYQGADFAVVGTDLLFRKYDRETKESTYFKAEKLRKSKNGNHSIAFTSAGTSISLLEHIYSESLEDLLTREMSFYKFRSDTVLTLLIAIPGKPEIYAGSTGDQNYAIPTCLDVGAFIAMGGPKMVNVKIQDYTPERVAEGIHQTIWALSRIDETISGAATYIINNQIRNFTFEE